VPVGSGLRRWTGWTPFTYPFNMTQQPAATVPVGVDGDGLPVGLQLVAARHRDDLVLRAAHALELELELGLGPGPGLGLEGALDPGGVRPGGVRPSRFRPGGS
jgi:aspartyl-tRNA(Asn)/glutamyl-tRNA(Gln) amidotransferase subunit A